MGRTYNFSSNGRLAAINGASTGADDSNIVIANKGASQLADNPNFSAAPDGPSATPSPGKGPSF